MKYRHSVSNFAQNALSEYAIAELEIFAIRPHMNAELVHASVLCGSEAFCFFDLHNAFFYFLSSIANPRPVIHVRWIHAAGIGI